MFITMELYYETWGWGKGKDNDRKSTILKYITSAHVEKITICTESCSVMEVGGKN
jgi:hypothetical protein